MPANKIKNMDDRDLAGEMCEKFAEMAKADNPRFKEDMFFAACDVDHYHLPPLSKCGMWSDPNLSVLHKTKAIRLVTADSNKLSR